MTQALREYRNNSQNLTHLIPKPEQNQDEEVFGECKSDKSSAHQDPEDEGTDEVGGGDALGGAVVQVDHHQEEGEEKTKPVKVKVSQKKIWDKQGKSESASQKKENLRQTRKTCQAQHQLSLQS